MTRLLAVVLLALFVSVPVISHAAISPTTMWWASWNGNAYSMQSTAAAACSQALGPRNAANPNDQCTLTNATDTACMGNCTQSGSNVQFANNHKSVNCPANSTLSGSTCACNSGYSEVNGACVASNACNTIGPASSTAYWDAGTTPTNTPPPVVCVSSCLASFVGVCPVKTAVVGGVTHFYCQGAYQFMGTGVTDTCTAGQGGISGPGASLASVPSDSCGAGQYKATVNGKTQCIDSSTNKAVATGPTYVAGTSCSSVTNADSTITQTCITQDAQGNQTTAKTTYPANTPATAMQPNSSQVTYQSSSTSMTSSYYGGGGGGASGVNPLTGQPTGSMGDFCAQNPSADACKTTTAGTGATVQGIYTKDGSGKTFAGSIQSFKNTIQAGGFYSAAVNFFSVSGLSAGSCSGLSTSITIMGKVWNIDIGQYLCGPTMDSTYTLAGFGLLLGATMFAFYIAIIL